MLIQSARGGVKTINWQFGSSTGLQFYPSLHEILISEEEMRHVQRRGDYYAISSMLPEIATTPVVSVHDAPLEYSSRNAVGDLDSTRDLLARNGLLEASAMKAPALDDPPR